MDIPLHYQVSEYDCVPTTFINAIACLFERKSIPPLVVRYIYAYSLDTVSRGGRLGLAGTSGLAVRLLGHWLKSYKKGSFSVQTEFLAEDHVHVRDGGPIVSALDEGGLALCNIYLGHNEWHFALAQRYEADWLEVFDPYRRRAIRGLADKVRMLSGETGRDPNLAIRRSWLDRSDGARFTLGELRKRECLLMWRVH